MTEHLTDALAQFPANEKILLHACCGPCLAFPARQLLDEGRLFLAWFHNPNIHPAAEHKRRLDGFWAITQQYGIEAEADSVSNPDPWVSWTGTSSDRCTMCYERRLSAVARETARRGLAGFTTTLLISPWQQYDAIVAIAHEAARKQGVQFLERDWRPFYREGQQLARETGIYRQRFCGCWPSVEQSTFKDKIKRELSALSESPESSDNGHR